GGGGAAGEVAAAAEVGGDGVALVVARAAQVSAEAQHRVNDRGPAGVVAVGLEADAAVGVQHVAAADRLPDAVDHLVEHRRLLDELGAGGLHHQVALGICLDRLGSLPAHVDLAGVGPGG